MKIAFVWYWERASEILPNWRDGLRAALEEIGREHTVDWYLDGDEPDGDKYDFILFWDDSNSAYFRSVEHFSTTKGIILTTDPHNINNLRKLDVVFCESTPIYEAVRAHGIHAVKAFGTDTDFYQPGDLPKDIPFFYPATFSPWKRQGALAWMGPELTCVGTVQPDGVEQKMLCDQTGVQIHEGYFPPEFIRDGYQRAENVPIPAIHGSERTVLEAMACGIVPIVNPLNRRTYSYIQEHKDSGLPPREFVLKNYSHKQYAATLLKHMQ